MNRTIKKIVFGFFAVVIVFIISNLLFGQYHSALSVAIGFIFGMLFEILTDHYLTGD